MFISQLDITGFKRKSMVVITFQTINKNDHSVPFGKEVGSEKRDDTSFIKRERRERKPWLG